MNIQLNKAFRDDEMLFRSTIINNVCKLMVLINVEGMQSRINCTVMNTRTYCMSTL